MAREEVCKAGRVWRRGRVAIGLELSAIEHRPRYLADFAWEPTLSAKVLSPLRHARVYGAKAVDAIVPLYETYDDWETPPAASPADFRPMLLGEAGWCLLGLPTTVPFEAKGLDTADWRLTVERANTLVKQQQSLIDADTALDRRSRSGNAAAWRRGRSWAPTVSKIASSSESFTFVP